MSEAIVRVATPADWIAIENLLSASSLPLAGARDHVGGFVVMERNGAIVACAALERYGATALLRSVAVAASERGNGLGERLVRHLIATAQMEGFHALVLLTTTAEDWFPRFGFRRIDRAQLPEALGASAELRGACPSTAVVMSLSCDD